MGKSAWYKRCDEPVDYWLPVKRKLTSAYSIPSGNDLTDFEESGAMFSCDKNSVYMRMEFVTHLGIVFYRRVFLPLKMPKIAMFHHVLHQMQIRVEY